jgi:hypothetical protein
MTPLCRASALRCSRNFSIERSEVTWGQGVVAKSRSKMFARMHLVNGHGTPSWDVRVRAHSTVVDKEPMSQ